MAEFLTARLENGLRVIHLPGSGKIAHMGLFINAGTRDEDPTLNGLAHFIEHTLFKGTLHRKSYHILTRLESVGGDLNAYTTKEETCVYATVLNRDFSRGMDLLSDIILHSTFPDKELKKEKDVILDEINSYKDNPSEEIYDVFEANLFPGHPLGMNILGTREHLLAFRREDALEFTRRFYHPENMVLCTTGGLSLDQVVRYAIRCFGQPVPSACAHNRHPFVYNGTFDLEMKRNTYQVHCIIGGLAYDRRDEKRIPLYLLNNILGGPAMNSRLNLTVRERHGYAYNIESVFLPYSDTGVFSVYLGTDPEKLGKVMELVEKEMKRMREEKLGTLQLSQARKQLTGQIAVANESALNRMHSAGKAYLHDNRLDPAEEIERKIMDVTASDLQDVANEILMPERLSRLVFKP
jgi:predicted Zn-dependent peptidase